jgi:serine/threonine-protein kinase
MLGTPQYMAPEQIRGEAIDGRTDVYALGCMIYEMVTARLPFEAPTIMAMLSKHLLEQVVPPTQRRPDLELPKSIDQLVLGAMAKDPKDRPPTMDQFSEMLAGLLQQLPQDPNRSSGLSPIVHVQNVVTPVAPSMYPAPTPAPPAFTPAPIPPTLPVAQQYSPPPPKKASKAPLFAIIGALVAGGTGVGVWAVMKSEDKPKVEPKTEEKAEQKIEEKKVEETPTDNKDPWKADGTSGDDPWAAKPNGEDTAPTPKAPRVPKTPTANPSYALPSGVTLSPPSGFKQMSSNEYMVTYANMKTGASMVMMPYNAAYIDALEQSGYEVVDEKDLTLQGHSWKLTQLENDSMGGDFQQWTLVGNGVIVMYQGQTKSLGNVEQVLGNSVRFGGGAKN